MSEFRKIGRGVRTATVVALAGLAGCGGSSHHKHKPTRAENIEFAGEVQRTIEQSTESPPAGAPTHGVRAEVIAGNITLSWLRDQAEKDAQLAIAAQAADEATNHFDPVVAESLLGHITYPDIFERARSAVAWGIASEAAFKASLPVSSHGLQAEEAIASAQDLEKYISVPGASAAADQVIREVRAGDHKAATHESGAIFHHANSSDFNLGLDSMGANFSLFMTVIHNTPPPAAP